MKTIRSSSFLPSSFRLKWVPVTWCKLKRHNASPFQSILFDFSFFRILVCSGLCWMPETRQWPIGEWIYIKLSSSEYWISFLRLKSDTESCEVLESLAFAGTCRAFSSFKRKSCCMSFDLQRKKYFENSSRKRCFRGFCVNLCNKSLLIINWLASRFKQMLRTFHDKLTN